MKRITVVLISIILAFGALLAGCGSSDSKQDVKQSSSPSAASTVPSSTPDAAKAKAFTIRIGAWFIDDRTVMKDFKTNVEMAYKKLYPNATIQWEITLGSPYTDKLKAQLASASAPDVIFNSGATTTLYTEGGYLADLSKEAWASKLIPAVKKSSTYKAIKDEFKQHDGKIYAASMGVGVGGYWYNKKIFADLGLQIPKNSQDLLAASEKIKQAGITPIALGFKDAWTASQHLDYLLQSFGYGSDETYGKDLFDGKKRLDGSEVQAVMQFFQTLKEKDYVNKNALSIDWPQSADLFTTGKAAIIMQGPWLPGAADDNFKKGQTKFDLGYFTVTDDKGYFELAPTTDINLSVNAKTELMQQSKDMVSLILSQDIYAPFQNGSGSISAIDGITVKYDNPVMNDVMPNIKAAKTSHNSWSKYVGPAARTDLTEVITKIVSGVKFNPDDLKAVQKKFEDNKSKITPPSE